MSNLGAGGGPPCYFSCWEPLVLKITNSELHIFQRRLGALFFRGGCLTKHSMWWISSIHQTKFEWNMSSTWKIFVNNRTKKLWNLNDEKKNVCKCTTLDWEWGSAESEDLLSEIFSLPRIGDTGGVGLERFGFLLLFHNYCQHNQSIHVQIAIQWYWTDWCFKYRTWIYMCFSRFFLFKGVIMIPSDLFRYFE